MFCFTLQPHYQTNFIHHNVIVMIMYTFQKCGVEIYFLNYGYCSKISTSNDIPNMLYSFTKHINILREKLIYLNDMMASDK